VCYRSQSAADSEIREMFTAVGQASKGRWLTIGDFNYPTINWTDRMAMHVCSCNCHKIRMPIATANIKCMHKRSNSAEPSTGTAVTAKEFYKSNEVLTIIRCRITLKMRTVSTDDEHTYVRW